MDQTMLTLDQLLAVRALGGGEGPQWLADGRTVVFVSPLAGSPELWTADVETGALQRLSVGLGGVGHLATFLPRPSPSGDCIAVVSARSGADEVWLQPLDGGPLRQLTRLGGRIEALAWLPDGAALLVAANVSGTFDIWRVEVASGHQQRISADDRYEVYPSATPDGRHALWVRLNDDWTDHEVVRAGVDGSDPEVVLHDSDFFDYHYGRTFGAPKIAPDGSGFLFRSHRSGWINVWHAPLDGSEDPRQIAPASADQGDACWSPDGRWIAYVENHDGTLDLRIVPAGGGVPSVLLTPELGVVAEPAWSPDGARIACLLGDPGSPNDVWVVDVASGERRRLTHSPLAGRAAERVVIPEKVRYPTWDGREISAYLYRPPVREPGQRFPGIVWIHGGPTAQYLDSWQPQVQYFVSMGYVVLLPNVRGSSGYGRAFEDLNNGDWGHGDLRDAIAGTEYLKTLDDVEPDSFGITGTSYGGIMAMAATSWAPRGAFRAAIACSGYGDFLHMAGEQELRHQKLLEYEFGRLPQAHDVYRRCSPIWDVAQAATPCFVLHGEGRYPGSSAGRDFALALEAAYKPFWYKVYPGETYYVAGTANVKRMLLDMRAYFDFYLKGIPHDLPDDASRPLTHLSGVISASGSAHRPPPAGAAGVPPRDMAN